MLSVGQLSPHALRARLAGPGLRLATGAFVTCVTSRIETVAHGIGLLYADYPVCEDERFADFYVNFRRPAGLRRWLRPQVRFDYDGMTPFKPLPLEQAFSMFEWSLNWCVSSRVHGCMVIHAAVVEKDGVAAILPAPPGSGKSTLCAALVCRGWRLLSDELTLVRLDDGRLEPLPRPISLKNGSIDLIRNYAPGAVFSPPVHDTAKGTIAHMKPPADSVRRAADAVRPALVVFPKYAAGAAPQLVPVPRARALLRVAENSFNYSLLGAEGFAACARLVESARTFDFSYSALDDAVAVFAQLVETA